MLDQPLKIARDFQRVLTPKERPINVIYVSSYIPRKCGIATYTKDLTNAVNLLNSRSLAEVLTITYPEEEIAYPWESKFKITKNDLGTYLAAAEYVNQSQAHLVSLQHEFGLFGGEGGEYIIHFVEALEKPLVLTLHTTPPSHETKLKETLTRLTQRAEVMIVMMEHAAQHLVQHYQIPREQIVVVPHGVPDLTFNSTESHKSKRRLTGRLVLGNINLLSPNKGIEYSLRAMPAIIKKIPQALYMVIGQTHPNLLRTEGEKYRNFLKGIVRELNLDNNVRFVNEYLPLSKLIDLLKTIDIYITPYLDPEQIASGALAYAIGAGKPCISTPYVYAQEVLDDKRGILVPFRDSAAIAHQVINLGENPDLRQEIEKRAYRYGRLMTWPNVAQSHLNLFRTVLEHYNNDTASPKSSDIPQYIAAPSDRQ